MAEHKNNLERARDFQQLRQSAEADMQEGLDAQLPLEEVDLEELESLEEAIGLEEADLDPAIIDTVAVDDTDDNLDLDDDDVVDDADYQETESNLPQELTQSYGTGLQGQPSDRAGRYSRRSDDHLYHDADATLTGGDVDANYEQASAVGDEAVGGTAATPDQDTVEEIAAALGVEIDDRTDVRINTMLEERDERRWELDPKSSQDYEERRE
jgi:hypothetical protein